MVAKEVVSYGRVSVLLAGMRMRPGWYADSWDMKANSMDHHVQIRLYVT